MPPKPAQAARLPPPGDEAQDAKRQYDRLLLFNVSNPFHEENSAFFSVDYPEVTDALGEGFSIKRKLSKRDRMYTFEMTWPKEATPTRFHIFCKIEKGSITHFLY
jgi:hypothetical protein